MTKLSAIDQAFGSFQGTLALAKASWAIAKRLIWAQQDDRELLEILPPQFLAPVGQAALRTCLQAIRTMSDPSQSMGRDNASAAGLLDAAASFRHSPNAELAAFESAAQPMRQLTNRAIAHDDWRAVTRLEVPAGVTQDQLQDALDAADQFADAFAVATMCQRRLFDPKETDSAISSIFEMLRMAQARD